MLPPVFAWDSVTTSGSGPTATGRWSLGLGWRSQTSVYRGQDSSRDFLPLITWNGEYLFLDGTRAGIRLWNNDDWRVEAFGAYRFGDYDPDDAPGLVGMDRDDSVDVGLSIHRKLSLADLRLDGSTDAGGKSNGQEVAFTVSRSIQGARWRFEPRAGVRWQSSNLAGYYYGVRPSEALASRPAYATGAAVNVFVGLGISYRISTHHFLSLDIEQERLDSDISRSPIIDRRNLFRAFLSYRYAFGGADHDESERGLFEPDEGEPWYLRVAGGFATETRFTSIVRGRISREERNTGIGSLFIGKRIAQSFFGLPIEMHATGGYVRHLERDIQPDFNEFVVAIKGYYQDFPWSRYVRTRIGLAEGLSYAAKIPTLEREKLLRKNPSTSRLLNYLDYSVDINVGDVFGSKSLERCYFGFSIHHRSGIFASADIFGNVSGGSNFNTLYLQCSNK